MVMREEILTSIRQHWYALDRPAMAVSILPARLIAVSFATAGSEAGMATPATLGNVR